MVALLRLIFIVSYFYACSDLKTLLNGLTVFLYPSVLHLMDGAELLSFFAHINMETIFLWSHLFYSSLN
jgi:hypothetical protein